VTTVPRGIVERRRLTIEQQTGGDAVTKGEFLTVRWNNWLSLGVGLPTLIFIAVALLTSIWATKGGLIALSIIGVLY
jgi:hypothetical protein